MKIAYINKRFNRSSWAVIQRVNDIIDEYSGLMLNVRQIFYQFVARGWIANKQSEYKRLGSIINDARLAGEIDWSAIEDRTRFLRSLSHWDSPADIVGACAD